MSSSKTVMPFGKHQDECLGDIPASYLLWFADQDWSKKYPDILAYIEKERKTLEQEAKEK